MAADDHNAVREGIIAGIIGATIVALWFLVVDSIERHPFFTPEVLGRAVLSVLGPPFDDTNLAVVWLYTIIHYVLFIVAGMIAAAVVHAANREPSLLLGAFILFVAFEVGFHGLVALLEETTVLGGLAWQQVMIGNLLAALGMGTYLWRAHPELRATMAHAWERDGGSGTAGSA